MGFFVKFTFELIITALFKAESRGLIGETSFTYLVMSVIQPVSIIVQGVVYFSFSIACSSMDI